MGPQGAAAPADIPSIVKWVEESFDVPSDEFEKQPGQMQQQMQIPGQQPGQPPQGQQRTPLMDTAPGKMQTQDISMAQ